MEQELKTKAAKSEQSMEKSIKSLRAKIKQKENMNKLRDNELLQLRSKLKMSETGKDQVSLELTKAKKGGKEKELEIKLLEKDKEIK